MAVQTKAPPQAKRSVSRRGFTLIIGIVSFGLLAYLLFQIVQQFVVPPPPHRLIFVQDVPLPSGLPADSAENADPAQEHMLDALAPTDPKVLVPGVSQQFDHF